MKTLNELVREIFAARRNNHTKLQNDKQDETDNHESGGVDNMDSEADPSTLDVDEEVGQSQPAGEPGSGGDPGGELEEDEATPVVMTAEELEMRLEESYRKGLIDGRNEKIEETYFPLSDDGIPQFRGRPSRNLQAADFFSMAREA